MKYQESLIRIPYIMIRDYLKYNRKKYFIKNRMPLLIILAIPWDQSWIKMASSILNFKIWFSITGISEAFGLFSASFN